MGEAITLDNIGIIYKDLGDMQKAFEYYGSTLELGRALPGQTWI